MSLNESIEDAALEWFGELGYAIGHGPHFAPGEPSAERDSFGDVVLVGRPNSAISSRPLATLRDLPLPKLVGGDLRMALDSAAFLV